MTRREKILACCLLVTSLALPAVSYFAFQHGYGTATLVFEVLCGVTSR